MSITGPSSSQRPDAVQEDREERADDEPNAGVPVERQ